MRRDGDVTKLKPSPTETDDQVSALLRRYQCTVPFHTVRTRFLCNIANPRHSGVAPGDGFSVVRRRTPGV